MRKQLALNLAPPKKTRTTKPKVTVRPTPEQLEMLHTRAASFGFKSLSKYLVERGLREGEMIASVERERIERLLFEVRKIGVNVNQMARRLNSPSGGRQSQESIDRAMKEVARVIGEVAEVFKS